MKLEYFGCIHICYSKWRCDHVWFYPYSPIVLLQSQAKDDKFNDKETTADDGKAAKSDSKQSKK